MIATRADAYFAAVEDMPDCIWADEPHHSGKSAKYPLAGVCDEKMKAWLKSQYDNDKYNFAVYGPFASAGGLYFYSVTEK